MKITDLLLYLIKENTRSGSLRWTTLGPEMYTTNFEGYDLIISGNSKIPITSVILTITGEKIDQTELIREIDYMYYNAIDLLRTVEDLHVTY